MPLSFDVTYKYYISKFDIDPLHGNLVNMLPNLRSTYLSVISTLINLISGIIAIYKKVLDIMFNEKNCQYFKQFIRNCIVLFIGGIIGISFFFHSACLREISNWKMFLLINDTNDQLPTNPELASRQSTDSFSSHL